MKLATDQQKQLNKFAQENGIRCIVLFGSRIQGSKATIRQDSDFDVAVLTMPDKNINIFDNYNSVLSGLAKLLGFPDHQIDLANLNEANILLRYEITSKGELLYGDVEEYEDYKAFSFREYIDARSLFDLESLLVQKRQILIKQAIEKAVQEV